MPTAVKASPAEQLEAINWAFEEATTKATEFDHRNCSGIQGDFPEACRCRTEHWANQFETQRRLWQTRADALAPMAEELTAIVATIQFYELSDWPDRMIAQNELVTFMDVQLAASQFGLDSEEHRKLGRRWRDQRG